MRRQCPVTCLSLVVSRMQLLLLKVVVAVFGLGSVPASQGLSETILCSQKWFGTMVSQGGGAHQSRYSLVLASPD